MTKDEPPPQITEQGDYEGHEGDQRTLTEEKGAGARGLYHQEVYGPPDEKGDKEEKKIHNQETQEPQGETQPVFSEINSERPEIVQGFFKGKRGESL